MPDTTEKKQGKFKKGRSGNPLGRPRGIRNKAIIAAEALFEGEIEGICRKAIEQAKRGNIQAIKLVLDRILPPKKEAPIFIDLPTMKTSPDILEAIHRVAQAVSRGELDRLNLQVADLEISDTAFQGYTRYGMSLLKDLTWYFQEAGLEAKRKLLGSIFPAKLTFQNGKYRTDGLNPALAIILQKTKNLENEKCGDIVISENVSGDVPMTGLEPALYR